ncbi:MAG: NADH-quinone oxidoreductase subunit NuoK [candidate division Zixibacteria bacterium]|nr:NADH-quinone oxidoreductase subunit NuoK [candidate division Zixibacteria bacterium]
MSIGLEHFLLLSGVIFTIGVIGVIIRRNAIVILMCIELMLNASNLALIGFSVFSGNPDGQIMVFFVIAVAAAEAAVGLALFVVMSRNRKSVNVDDFNLMKW